MTPVPPHDRKNRRITPERSSREPATETATNPIGTPTEETLQESARPKEPINETLQEGHEEEEPMSETTPDARTTETNEPTPTELNILHIFDDN